jgi:hypothetical protein
METRQQDPKVDELRQQLRSLGYLDAGVDRFVLAPATGGRTPIAIAVRASLRIGILAGALLGPASTIWLQNQLPGLITGPRDASVVALYLALLSGIGGMAAAFAASAVVLLLARLAGPTLARHSRALSLAAGFGVAIASLVYLTLWSQQARQVESGLTSGIVIVALVYSALVSVLLGHAVTLTTLALIVVSTGSTPVAPGVPGASWRLTLAAGALAFCGGLLLFTATASMQPREAPPAPLTVVSSGLRVRLIAVDGFDQRLFDDLAARGRVPALSGFKGAQATLDSSDSHGAGDVDPARTWTTIATGQPVDVHGVRGLETREVAGVRGRLPIGGPSPIGRSVRAATDLVRLTRPAIASGSERRVKTFWEVAGDAGLRTAVVNWWATWPATTENGIVLSDRATLRLERGGQLDGEIAPAAAYDRLRERWSEIRRRAEALAINALEGSSGSTDTAALLRRSAELDALQLVLVQEIASAGTDLAVVYLPGLDIVQHAILRSEGGTGQSASAMAAALETLEAYYVALDRLLGPIVQPKPSELVALITAPGRVSSGATGRLTISSVVTRPGVAEGTARDVAPIVLYALGVPLSRELPGTPLLSMFTDEFTRRFPVRNVPSYGTPSARPGVREGKPLDQEMIDRLRSLGYVK